MFASRAIAAVLASALYAAVPGFGAVAPSGAQNPAQINVAGSWTYSAPSGTGNIHAGELTIVSHGWRGYSGLWISGGPEADSSNVKVTVKRGIVTIRVPTRRVPVQGAPADRFVTIVAQPQPGGTLSGRWYRESGASGDWAAVRR